MNTPIGYEPLTPHASPLTATAKIFVAGHRGLVGSAVERRLRAEGYTNLVLRTRKELDLLDYAAVAAFFERERPEVVIDAAARVGGIHANNTYPADFIRDNLFVQNNLIDNAWRFGARKLVFLGSSCIYPKHAPQPMKEEHLLTGPLEPTNEWYAIAKIAGIKMCQAYRKQHGFDAISLMPTNLYGPGDNFNLESSHVLPALIRKFHEAKLAGASAVTVWGTGTPRREFLHVDDMAAATVFLAANYSDSEIVNVGVGEDVSIRELAELVRDAVGFTGELEFDTTKPDGTPRKLLDVTRLHGLGWKASIPLAEGIRSTYDWFLQHQADFRT
ncbi:GDP-L-fucose synthase [Methylococcus sp. EFPC2]|uniref:GDP-L-fucose synthase n=1 Tax=Methylococcus sp. EFPC2 TaxID=2812648 RepID=UPI0019683BFC|nr:GDP-L-fucose synthase [Methylococcus sp. EFPC2]QSA98941.1 GDP-L-fucose synthase [Methylococcus sp. EFPC2]